jgi:hypothetical protein
MNAKEAMPLGGTLVVKANNVELSGSKGDAKAGKYVQIDIQDNGLGIAPNHLDRIFDPYFTTKQMGSQKGMGLGLSVAHSIVKQHNGHINVSSRLDQGGQRLPFFCRRCLSQTAYRHDTHAMSRAPKQATRKILFMDDEMNPKTHPFSFYCRTIQLLSLNNKTIILLQFAHVMTTTAMSLTF